MLPKVLGPAEGGTSLTPPWVPEVIYTVHPRAESIKVTFLCC